MTGKKHSVLRAAILITLIVTLNLVGISYGYWQDNLAGKITAYTGNIDLSFKNEIKMDSDGFDTISAKLVGGEGSKVIEVDGTIERDSEGIAKGKFILDYIVENNGSLPVMFDGIQVEDSEMNGFTIIKEPDGMDIGPNDSSDDSLTIQIDASASDDTQGDDVESDSLEEETSDTYKFEIVLPYSINSWTDKVTINGSIEVAQSSDFAAMPIPMLSIISSPVQGGIDTGGLPDGPSDEDLYGEGGTTAEADEPEIVEDDNEQVSEGNDGEESPGDEELYDTGGAAAETDEPEAIEDDSESTSESEDVEEGSRDQEQADGGEATEETDEPEAIEDNSEPASVGDDEGESYDDQVQIDAGEGN